MPIYYKIPKILDSSAVDRFIIACDLINQKFPDSQFTIYISDGIEGITSSPKETQGHPRLARFFEINGAVLQIQLLCTPANGAIAQVQRLHDSLEDRIEIHDNFENAYQPPDRAFFRSLTVTALQQAFGITEFAAKLAGLGAHEWGQYRELQLASLNRLEQLSVAITENHSRRAIELDRVREEKFQKQEAELQAAIQQERAKLNDQIAKKEAELARREEELKANWAKYNTEQSGLEARSLIQKQVDDLSTKLSQGWKITTTTSSKRWAVGVAYGVVITAAAVFTGISTYQGYTVISGMKPQEITQLPWWTLGFLSMKSFLSFGAFVTFMVYFIRWLNAWARQHAEEEFEMRARVIDIRRAGWLLEAIRDANEKGKAIPDNLLQELSRNLFAPKNRTDDTTPQTLHEIIKSVAVDLPGGSKVVLKNK